MLNAIQFAAQFKKMPIQITAVKQDSEFAVPNPWGEGELTGQPGDYLVHNLKTIEKYPVAPNALTQKYVNVDGDTWESKPVVLEGRLPEDGESTIQSREGETPVRDNGIPRVIMTDVAGNYAIEGAKFVELYEGADEDGIAVVNKLKDLLA